VNAAVQAEPADELQSILESTRRSLARSARVRRNLPGAGRLFFDRPAPFLCGYRKGASEPPGDAALPTTQAAFLVAAQRPKQASRVCEAVIRELSPRYGGFLLVELWPSSPGKKRSFRVHAPPERIEDPAVAAMQRALTAVRIEGENAEVRVTAREEPAPPRRPPLLEPAQREELNTLLVGIEYPPVFRNDGNQFHPAVLRRFRRSLGVALQKIFYEFAQGRDSHIGPSYQALAFRGLSQAALSVDRRLSEVSSSFDFLLHVTPVDVTEKSASFRARHAAKEPTFSYRPLPFEPRELKRLLYAAPLERVEDPVLWELFAQKQDELDRQITMLLDRGSSRFRHGSIALYGGVDDDLIGLARHILDVATPDDGDRRSGELLCPEQVVQRAQQEISYYREREPLFHADVEVRDDLAASMMVSKNRLMISPGIRLVPRRMEALLHHEIGTHLVTWFNGSVQPLQLLRDGAAGYEPTQEGLAVLAEYLSGGLTRARMRTLAARVEAVHCMIAGADFIECFRNLRKRGFSQSEGFGIAARVYRGGGFAKDAAYLKGLRDLLRTLGKGAELAPLLVGKAALRNLPALVALSRRDIVRPPALLPRYMDSPEALERLKSCSGRTVLDLFAEVNQ
jgi:uncharacterized protein (TIGR02421 family)